MQKNCSTGSHDEREGGEGEAWDWKPLNDLVEAANRSKSSKLTSVVVKSEACVIKSEGGHVQRKAKGKDELSNKVEDDDDKDKDTATEVVTPPIIKMRRNRKKKSADSTVVDAVDSSREKTKRTYPIWFQLVPFQQQSGLSLSLSELLLVNFVFSNGWFSLQGRGALEADRRTLC